MLGGLGGGGDDEGDPYNFDMGGGDDFGGFGQSDSFDDAPKRPSKKAPPKRPTSKGGRSLGPKPISSDVGTKTFKKASASDVLAKAQAMLSKAPTGSGQKEKKKETRRSRSPSMDADGIMANLSSSEDGSPKKKTTTLRRLDTQSFDPDSSFAEDEDNEVDLQPQQATSPVNDDDENILNNEIARQSVYGQVRDASALVQEEEVSEDEVASEQEEEENPPLTETAKAQFTSSIHGNVRSITDLPSRLGAPPTRDSSQFEFGAEVLQSPRAPAAAPSQSPQKLPPKMPKPKMRRQVSFDAAHASRDDAVQMRESNEEEPLDESVADESLERSPALSGRPFASDNSGEFLRESIDDETYSEEFHEGTMSRTASPRAPAGPPLVPPVQQGPPASVVAPPIPAVAPAPAPPPPPPQPQKPVIVADDLPCGVDFTLRLDKVPLSSLDGSVTRLVEEDVSRALGIPRRVVQVTSVRESLAGPQASVLECRIQVKDGASARRLGEVLTRAPPILLEREAPDFSSCRYLDRVRVRDDPSPKAMPTAYPFGEATKIRGPASGPQPVRLLVYDEDEDEDVDVDEAEGALHLVRTREVATQFCGNDASIQTAYVPTTMGAAHPAFKAVTEATDAALDSLDPSLLNQPPPPPQMPFYGYPPQPYMMMPPPQVSPVAMKEARADFDRMLRDQQKLHDMLASVRQDLEKAHADVMNAVPQASMPPAAASIKQTRPPDLPYWKAYMDVDPSLSEQEARELAFNDVKGKTTLGTGPVGAEEAKAGGPRE